MFLPVGFQVYFRQFCFLLAVQGLFVGIAVLEVVRRGSSRFWECFCVVCQVAVGRGKGRLA